MPKPFSDALGSCMKLPARDAMPQLLARLTLRLAELPEDLVGWVSVALAHLRIASTLLMPLIRF